VFESYSDAPSGWPLAPDKPTVRRNIASVQWLGQLAPTAIWLVVTDTEWSDARHMGTVSSSDSTTFQENFPTSSLPC
jgi:hypothetical protein